MTTRPLLLCTLLIAQGSSFSQTGTIPADRPRARPASALTGWADWEKGAELLKRIKVPPAPVLSAADEAKTFKLAPGYKAELVACEPMVQCPIFFEFDADGRIWVVEYQGYMRDVKGSGEADPICRLVVLEDTDDDGRADKSTVYLDKLVMPRSFAFVKGGLLLQEPPKLWFCEDTDGDLKCDRRTEVGTMGVGGNPQHTANGLRRGIDNWLHCADWPHRYQWKSGKLLDEETMHRGQFGVSFDNTGRFISCYENSAVHMDLLPADAIMRNPSLATLAQRSGRSGFGVNVNIAKEAQEVYPIRVTPAVTLGALELRDDGRLRTYTIVSGTCFYDGDQFPSEMRGNVFVPESGGHLVGTLSLSSDALTKAKRFFAAEQELMASTDERFRPVNARTGPDGALYLADMYHGIIEHVIFIVPWLTDQIADRKLNEGNDHGRIWRIVHEQSPRRPTPKLTAATTSELVALLGHANGWHRHTAQRLLIDGDHPDATKQLTVVLEQADSHSALQRLHALWTVNGLGQTTAEVMAHALTDPSTDVRAAAALMLSRNPKTITPAIASLLASNLTHQNESVQLMALLAISASRMPDTMPQLLAHLTQNASTLHRMAVISGMHLRESDLLAQLLANADWKQETADRRDTLHLLAQLSSMSDKAKEVLSQMDNCPSWQQEALADGLLASLPSDPRRISTIALPSMPSFLQEMGKASDLAARERVQRLKMLVTWPGSGNTLTQSRKQPMSQQDLESIQRGAAVYMNICGLCHMPTGYGIPNVAPPLADSPWATGAPERLVRIALHGLYGEIDVNGQKWNLTMPGQGQNPLLNDGKLADVLSYIRNSWGNEARVITAGQVSAIREQTKNRTMPWTADTLMQIDLGHDQNAAAIQADGQGTFTLPAKAARTYGQKLAYRPSLDVLAPWRIESDIAEWTVNLPESGTYEALVTLAADEASAGDSYVIESSTSTTTGTVQATGSYDHFVEQNAGTLSLAAGAQSIIMRPSGALKQELADVRMLRLIKKK